MSLGCACCGDCCDPVTFNADMAATVAWWLDHWASGGTEEHPDPTMRFIYENMHLIDTADTGEAHYACTKFDPTTRLCTAHDDAPPMCQNFPYFDTYGITAESLSKLPSRCSYQLDAPPELRNPGARPLIPLTVKGRTP